MVYFAVQVKLMCTHWTEVGLEFFSSIWFLSTTLLRICTANFSFKPKKTKHCL